MRRGLGWYKRDPIAFLDGVQGMGAELIGAYAVLLDLFYARGGETPRDDRHLAGLLGCSLRKAAALTDRLIDLGKITADGDFIFNSRAKSEAKLARNHRETLVKHGRDGAEKRWGNRKNKDLAIAPPIGAVNSREEKEKRREGSIPSTSSLSQPAREAQPPAPSPLSDEEAFARKLADIAVPDPSKGIPAKMTDASFSIALMRWRQITPPLTDREIEATVEAATRSALARGDPPASPAYFDRALAAVARQKTEPVPTTNGGSHVGPDQTRAERAAERRIVHLASAADRVDRFG